MANIQTWDGTATFSAGMTPFGFYDSDSEFQSDAIKVSKFCGSRLGYPLMDVELQSGSFFACFEEATSDYSTHVNNYKAIAIADSSTDFWLPGPIVNSLGPVMGFP